jgi:hypothetical protein
LALNVNLTIYSGQVRDLSKSWRRKVAQKHRNVCTLECDTFVITTLSSFCPRFWFAIESDLKMHVDMSLKFDLLLTPNIAEKFQSEFDEVVL